jgi:hypothetical protein
MSEKKKERHIRGENVITKLGEEEIREQEEE